ncbi:uncharacterized protein L969DRAFT_92549 [Mixia osmundae IAM 14324]|uniref:Large ribosomal subunit protein mL59 domain-containing protein n=1 Tax=Mixia osmundae (strain CBS 9802 / IAM 14324 / JCM 22182 / KY 12970) TaxID=764103 RepID=G7DXV6_MIXOS|nr:uncharacterized protein L969DRAFT_92549 [Mixia osmundae IAM 14324]KEI41319.1 hypothetical protein L969DRAFT_92549 [Mixia osmundae IAM 14324]GAA95416.1 hypothetical protein E5Q_02070 [Mixia osmundae IAM 14324]
MATSTLLRTQGALHTVIASRSTSWLALSLHWRGQHRSNSTVKPAVRTDPFKPVVNALVRKKSSSRIKKYDDEPKYGLSRRQCRDAVKRISRMESYSQQLSALEPQAAPVPLATPTEQVDQDPLRLARMYRGRKQPFKGHVWERTAASRQAERVLKLEEMPKRIALWQKQKAEAKQKARPALPF